MHYYIFSPLREYSECFVEAIPCFYSFLSDVLQSLKLLASNLISFSYNQFITMNIRSFLTGETNDNDSCFPSLTFNERLMGFAICVGVGYIIQLLSFGSFLSLATGSPAKFAILFSFGNIISIAGTGFLIGFKRQLQSMVDEKRRTTSLVFGGALLGTLVSAILFDSRLLVFLCLIVQIPAYIWYCASYFPFAQDCIRSCLRGVTQRFRR